MARQESGLEQAEDETMEDAEAQYAPEPEEAPAPPPARRPRTTKGQARARAAEARETKVAMERSGTTDVRDTWPDEREEVEPSDLAARVEHLEATNRRNGSSGEGEKARQQAAGRASQTTEEDDLPPLGDEGLGDDEPLPIEMLSPRGASDPYLSVQRIESNGPGKGYEEGSEYTGPCGNVIHRQGFEEEIRRRWGGGHYKVTARVKGKTITAPLVFNGIPSLPVDEAELGSAGEGAPEAWGPPPTRPGFAGYQQPYAQQQFQPPFAQQFPAQFAPQLPPGWSPAPGGGYFSPWGYSHTPPNPATTQQQMAQIWKPSGGDSPEITLMRDELEKTRQDALEAKKQTEIEKVRRDFEVREKELTQKIELLVNEVRTKRDDTGGISDLIKIQAQQWEREREDRRIKSEEDALRRSEEREREERQRREERDKYERDTKERREREDREFREREARLREERDRDAKQREQADRQWEKLTTTMFANQPKLTEILGMVETVKKMAGPDDTFSKVTQMVETVAALKGLADERAEPEETGMDKAQRLIDAVGRAVTPALGEVAKMMGKKSAEEQQQPLQEIPYQQAALPMPTPTPAAPPQQTQAQAQGTDLSPQQWGKVLRFVVDAHQSKSGPDETAAHLFTMLRAFDAIQAAERIGEATVETFKSKVTLLRLSGKITDPVYLAYMEQFTKMCGEKGSAEWVGALIGYVKNTCAAIRQRVAAAQAQGRGVAVEEEEEGEDEGE